MSAKISSQCGLQSVNESLETPELKAVFLCNKASKRTGMKHEDAQRADPGEEPGGEGKVSETMFHWSPSRCNSEYLKNWGDVLVRRASNTPLMSVERGVQSNTAP